MQLNCPLCQGLFQIDSSMAGQRVACPHCQGVVTAPAAPAPSPAPPPEPAAAPATTPQLACPFCQGLFAVQPQMAGKQVNCPHCRQAVSVPAMEAPLPSPEEPAFPNINVTPRGRGRSSTSIRSRSSETNLDWLAQQESSLPSPPSPGPSAGPIIPPGAPPPSAPTIQETKLPAPQPAAPTQPVQPPAAPIPTPQIDTGKKKAAIDSMFPPGAAPTQPAPQPVPKQPAPPQEPAVPMRSPGTSTVDSLLPPGVSQAPSEGAVPTSRSGGKSSVADSLLPPGAAAAPGRQVALPSAPSEEEETASEEQSDLANLKDPVKTVGYGPKKRELRKLSNEEKEGLRLRNNLIIWGACAVIMIIVTVILVVFR